jgi:hypothetical protein
MKPQLDKSLTHIYLNLDVAQVFDFLSTSFVQENPEQLTIWASSTAWRDAVAYKIVHDQFQPQSDAEFVIQGRLGTLIVGKHSIEVLTDAFDHPSEKELYSFDLQIYSKTVCLNITYKAFNNELIQS